ncbi:protein Wnt-9b-like [Paramacrobiotus metropolitanus]|uniref:protein Wnt-9b-like n=1 Tax=Paramacrobiotus metropolitanus TaxID=2943436 RepID=UPI00244642A9|nr:protein Wnt-9b-like [Paramacrobiotus metropolitanus]
MLLASKKFREYQSGYTQFYYICEPACSDLLIRKAFGDLSNERAIIMCFLAQLQISMCALLHLMGPTNGFFGLTSHRREFDDVIVPTLMKENPLISNQVLPGYHGSNQLFSGDDCRPLYLHRKQRDVCRTHEGFSETLKEAIVLSVTGCQKELRYERWNCSLGRSRRFLLKKRYKETAFLNAINAASLIHTFSRACSRGQLASSCSCQASYNEISSMALTAMDAAWRWSGCSDNTDAAEAIIRNFANKKQLGRSSNVNHIDQHNFNVGLKLVKRKRSTVCKCHGVSGSCSTRSCWTVVQPMAKTTKAIRKKFLSAKKMTFEKNAQRYRPADTSSKSNVAL